MITKWFIGVSAVSKGFVTGWNEDEDWRWRSSDNPPKTTPKPSFTKQSALATSYNTKEEADKIVEGYIKEAEKQLKEAQKKLDLVLAHKDIWDTITFDEKVKFCREVLPKVTYQTTRGYNNNVHDQDVYFGQGYGSTTGKPFSDVEKKAITNNMNWKREIEHKTAYVQLYKNRIEFCKTKMIVREQEIEIKFMDNERRELKWTNRDESDTSGDYCNCCGGAVPGVPQLHIKGKRWNEYTIICGICMGKLSQEAQIQVSKIPQELLEHYQTDRFLKSMD